LRAGKTRSVRPLAEPAGAPARLPEFDPPDYIPRVKFLARFDLFRGLSDAELDDIARELRPRTLAEGEYLCRKGEAGHCLWLISSGLLEVRLPGPGTTISVLRRHDLVGEASLLTSEPRSADVVAVLPTEVLELDQAAFARASSHYPHIFENVIRLLLRRQTTQNERIARQGQRGEVVTLVAGAQGNRLLEAIVAAVHRNPNRRACLFDLTGQLGASGHVVSSADIDAWRASLDQAMASHRVVINIAQPETPGLRETLLHSDRVVLLMSAVEAARFCEQTASHRVNRELILAEEEKLVPGAAALPVIRAPRIQGRPDPDWLARHLTRTKLGLALGAGGARGYAHVAAIRTLREAGYCFDYVTGASIGSIVGSGVAMGFDDRELARSIGHLLSYDVCGPYFRLNKELSVEEGLKVFFDALGEHAGGRQIEDLPTPFALMTADLNSRRPFLFQEGSLAEALCAALSIPGLAPPYAYQQRRLVDGVTISPVPTRSARDLGADIVVSINLMSRGDLPEWPPDEQGCAPEVKPSKPIDPVVETVIMLQTDTSVRHAGEADVVITPRFGPSSWRDIHYAKLFEQAGRTAAEENLPLLRALV